MQTEQRNRSASGTLHERSKDPETRKHLRALVLAFMRGIALAEGSHVVDLLHRYLGG